MIGHAALAILILLSLITAGAVWVLLVRRDGQSPLSTRQLIRYLLMAGLGFRILYALLNPTFNSPDEEAHFNYVRYLHEHQTLAVQTTTNAPTNDWEYHQPPLYYVALWPIFGLVNALTSSVHAAVVALRAVSILIWWLFAAATLRMLDRLGVESAFLTIFTIGYVSLAPSWVALSSSINNDIPLCLWSALILERLFDKPSRRNAIILGMLSGLALLTKATALLAIAAIGFVYLARLWRKETTVGAALSHGAIITGVMILLWSPLVYWNLNTYGQPLGMGEAIAEPPLQWATPLHALRDAQNYLKESIWAAAGEHNKVRFFPSVGVHLMYFALIGLVVGAIRHGFALTERFSSKAVSPMVGFLATLLLNVAVVLVAVRFSHGHGRFVFPLLGVIGLTFAWGLANLSIERLPRISVHTTGFFLAYSTGALIYNFAYFLRTIRFPWYL